MILGLILNNFRVITSEVLLCLLRDLQLKMQPAIPAFSSEKICQQLVLSNNPDHVQRD